MKEEFINLPFKPFDLAQSSNSKTIRVVGTMLSIIAFIPLMVITILIGGVIGFYELFKSAWSGDDIQG